MSTIPYHIIRQQYLYLEINGTESEGMVLHRTIPALCRDWLLPAMERIFDRYAPADEYLSIERLEIDAGRLRLERLEQELCESVTQALEGSLREQLALAKSSGPFGSANVQHKTAHQLITEAFIYFLGTGTLPWAFRLKDGGTLEEAILRLWQDTPDSGLQPPTLNDAVIRVLASAHVRQRLLRQFSPLFSQTLLSLLSPEGKAVMDGLLHALRSSEVAEKMAAFERQLWDTAFGGIAAGKLLTQAYLVAETWRALSERGVEDEVLLTILIRHWPQALTNYAADLNARRERDLPKVSGSEKTPAATPEHADACEGIYIENAGLVLLHPFLPQFFAALGIAAEDKLLQPERALCLLHLVATGQPIAPEYELMLPKILCEIPLQTPVECDVDLTDLEKEEAGALLEAVVRHWGALGDSSADALRGTFLFRSGKVSVREDGDWLLQVESKTVDILLDQLPWGISMIKLPWMKKMLWVEWQ